MIDFSLEAIQFPDSKVKVFGNSRCWTLLPVARRKTRLIFMRTFWDLKSLNNNRMGGKRIKNRASEDGSNGWGQSGRSLGVRQYPWLCLHASLTHAERAVMASP